MITLQNASDKELERWDDFIHRSENGTLFHTRQFLKYHKGRFKGREHLMTFRSGTEFVAAMTLCIEETDSGRIAKSPYGGSFGGIVYSTQPTYSQSVEIVEAFITWLQDNDIQRCTFTPPTRIFSNRYSDTFTFTLQEKGFLLSGRDVCSVLPLNNEIDVESHISSNARNMVKKAEKQGVQSVRNATIDQFWPILEETYARHGATPTHRKEELSWLVDNMGSKVSLHVALHEGSPIAGVCEFRLSEGVNSAFYICQRDGFEALQGPSLIIFDSIKNSLSGGCRYYDFGTSTVNMTARPGVFRFKESFKAVGVFRESFEWRRA